jgi:FkbM family methyltransferase
MRTLRRDQRYSIAGVEVLLPPEHRLPYFQAVFPSYDRYFGPVLGALAQSQPVLLVDVGANVGDTAVAAVRASEKIDVIAVEGNPYFVGYLRRNVAPFASRVRVVDRYVGPLDSSIRYTHNGSTGGFVKVETTAAADEAGTGDSGPGDSGPVDWVEVSSLVDDPARLVVWKCDTDGFDIHLTVANWDVLHRSCAALWMEYDPVITQGDPADIAELGRLLADSGRTVWMFDNVGTHMVTARGPAVATLLADLTTWLRRQRESGTGVAYLDLWAFDDSCLADLPDPKSLP